MLKDSLYTIISLELNGASIQAELELDPAADIFKGHFPGQPVLPGACMLQILKEIVQTGTGLSIVLKKATSIKFLAMADPRINKIIFVKIDYNQADDDIRVNAAMLWNEKTCCKLQGTFAINHA